MLVSYSCHKFAKYEQNYFFIKCILILYEQSHWQITMNGVYVKTKRSESVSDVLVLFAILLI